MANILLTNYCNMHCKYCFAMERVEVGTERGEDIRLFISLKDVEYCLDFLRRSRLRMVSLLGGEPTLHPNFAEILDLCRKDRYFTHIKLFTNGLMSDQILEYLMVFEDPELHIALNIHPPSDYLPDQRERIREVLETLGAKIGLGYNIYQQGNDFDYLLELILKHRLAPHLRLGLAQPILGVNNVHLPLEAFPGVSKEIVMAAERFTRRGIYFSFDCGFPFCMFSMDQHKKLLSLAIPFRSLCSPIIDIGPDLSTWRCFPLSRIRNRRLEEFETRMDVEFFYQELFRYYQQFGIYSRCTDCPYKRQALCTGGCLSRVLRQFHGGVKEEGEGGRTEV